VHTAGAVFPVNAPNVLTLARILLVPVLVVALLDQTDHGDLLAAIAFALASLTDAIDGYLARSRNAVTTFGKLMDPVADKLLIVAALVALVSLDRLPGWVAMVIIAREFAVTVTRLAATQQGVVIAANWWGKAKTITQVVAIFFAIAYDPTPAWVDVLVYGAVVITVVSGIDYFFGLRRLLREAEAGAARSSAR
jgi:CDP-diacylglycerol---glycerol-3-phosphate 3-phosphatidyltransferase